MLNGVRVAVTGASGFLGPWLCQKLLAADAVVIGADICFDSQSRIHELARQVELCHLDVEDFDAVARLFNERRIQLVFHLAAQALVGEALKRPLKTISTNVMGTANILEAARRLMGGPSALAGIVVASSDKAYGDQDNLPYLEDAPMLGRYPYDVSKSCADLIALSYFHSYMLPVCVTRCGNLFGGGDLNWSRIVPGTIRSVLEGAAPVIRSDGTLVRDYIYVEDAADAMVLVAHALMADPTIFGESFNISNDCPLTVIEMVDAILKVMGRKDLKPIIEGTARGEIKAQYLSSRRLRARLGWSPQGDLTGGLEKTEKWYRMRSQASK